MTKAEEPTVARPSRAKRNWANAVRVVLIALVIWTSYWAAKTVRRIVAGPQNPSPVEAESKHSPPSFAALTDQPVPGFWAFEKQPWAIAQTKISPAEFERHVLARLESKSELTAPNQNLLANFQRLGAPVSLGKNGHLYRTSATGGPFAVTRGAGADEHLVAAGFVMPEADGHWLVLEMLPAPAAESQAEAAAKSLLPLPANSKRLMSRWSNEGVLILDWIHVSVSAQEMVAEWNASGLKLRKTAGIIGAESSYLCEQNGEVIIVNAFPSTEGGVDLLITKSTDVQPSSEVGTTDRTP